VLAIMLLYPIYTSISQIAATMLLAGGHTRTTMFVTLLGTSISVPLAYLMLAPSADVLIPGLALGAIGMAFKMLLLNAIAANLQAWLIARYSDWKFDWLHQAVGVPLMVALGYLAKMLVELHWDVVGVDKGELIVPVMTASFVYALCVLVAIW